MSEPVTITPTMQIGPGDCAIACLAMLLGVPHQAIMAAVPHKRAVMQRGLSNRQIVNIGKRLGREVRRKGGHVDLEEDVGILKLESGRDRRCGHAVVLVKGLVINPADGLVWVDAETFLKTEPWRPDVLLEVME